ncbi:unnamed protein product [Vitrella brassicaformis CCMP3155]|uniref:Phosphoglycerate mutase family protein n=2 Tax=Vitrella brassicaformis TaxID=1169539 RepID=A0A0G4GAA6_VITBC|nr:unnamed protein product [Vitrella brassicaformis CCMP3155]|mmetsp:Transcript_22725/g.56066  ORF Transcript_22725/g.56066 Transcript_22725/m.56066 type:complete len:369 (+) Transcript_22725:180-1286(+)|eukprot:CEM25814.1 unnamed protein product [Vitrella brassicaformis CCMP3155]
MRFYFLRHGQSKNNASYLDDSKIFKGRVPDPSMTDLGWEQVRVAGKYLRRHNESGKTRAEDRIVKVFVSPMTRALQTAQVLHEELGVPVECVANLHEQGGLFLGERNQVADFLSPPDGKSDKPSPADASAPIVRGATRSQLQRTFPFATFPAEITEQGWWRGGFETFNQAVMRARLVARWMWSLVESNETGACVFVTHGIFQDLLVKLLLGLSLSPPSSTHLNGSLPPPFPSSCLPQPFPESGDPRASHLLCSNVGLSLLDLKVIPRPSTDDDGFAVASMPSSLPRCDSMAISEGKESTSSSSHTSEREACASPITESGEGEGGGMSPVLVKQQEMIRAVGVLLWNSTEYLPPELKTGHCLEPFRIKV